MVQCVHVNTRATIAILINAALACPVAAPAGVVRLAPKGGIVVPDADARIVPTVFYPGWASGALAGGYAPEADGSRRWRVHERRKAGGGAGGATNFLGRTAAKLAADGSLGVSFSMETVAAEVAQIQSVVSVRLEATRYAGGRAVLDGKAEKRLPAVHEKGRVGLFTEMASEVALFDSEGKEAFSLRFPRPTKCHLQDSREWKGGFDLRLSFGGKGDAKRLERGDAFSLDFALRAPDGVVYTGDRGAFVVEAGRDWTPIRASADVAPGSALDFSKVVPRDAPAGKHGWLVERDGHFEFENLPGVKQRFYGVNIVGEANVPPERDADRFVAGLVRVGYNAVRFHHHDSYLADGRGELKPDGMAKFDALVAACVRHGVYMTTDLFVSRKVDWRDVGIDRPGRMDKNDFKVLVESHEGACSNFVNYARNFLSHVNPHTGRRYADEPAMPLYSLLNEGNRRLKVSAEGERAFARRMRRFVRDELKSRILLTNMNSYGFPKEYDGVRANEYDYADDHFYVDHPRFIERKWALPSALDNENPARSGRGIFGRLRMRERMGRPKPFVITEYNFSGPGAYRSLGGIETGAVAAREDVDGVWRFAWGHALDGAFVPGAMRYFDICCDPLSLAGERAALCLYLRGDLKTGDRDAIRLDANAGTLRVATARTCGGFAEKGTIQTGALEARLEGAAATVWASAIDAEPLATSRRILVCHQTDVQNSGIKYADDSRTVLLAWGRLPHLMRRGQAEIGLAVASGDWKVYALDCAGRRRGEVPCRWQDGRLGFVADVSRDPSDATMNYELVR